MISYEQIDKYPTPTDTVTVYSPEQDEYYDIESISYAKDGVLDDGHMVLRIVELVCEDCSATGKDVKETLCPYALDVWDRETTVFLCDDCYRERSYDV